MVHVTQDNPRPKSNAAILGLINKSVVVPSQFSTKWFEVSKYYKEWENIKASCNGGEMECGWC